MMRVEIDDRSGFCFGVVNAISKAEELIAAGGEVYSLGDIVHNRIEMERLENLGLRTIRHDALAALRAHTLLIRAHGEPPRTYLQAERNGLRVADATCPVVARLQRRIKEAYGEMNSTGGQVVLLGKRGHAEVTGLTGQVADDVIVVEGLADLDAVDFSRPVCLLSQTTQSLELFEQVRKAILERATDPAAVTIHDTICRQVSGREEHLRKFSRQFDVVLFVSGRDSSNGRVLFEVCREANPRSYKIEEEGEIDPVWLAGAQSAGICGATSTPRWLMQRVAGAVEQFTQG